MRVTAPVLPLPVDGDRVCQLESHLNVRDAVLAGNVAQLWAMDYPNESPHGIAGRIPFVRMNIVGS